MLKPVLLTVALITNILNFEVARTPSEKEKGMMNRASWGQIDGMIFINSKPQLSAYWMKNTSLPMTLFYMDNNLNILEEHTMKPYSLDVVISETTNVSYILEIKPELAGVIRENQESLGLKLKSKLIQLSRKSR